MENITKFYPVCKALNKFGITPLLFGSVGLEYITNKNLNSDDIDILIPKKYVTTEWESFKTYFEKELKCTMVDLHEHTFEKDGLKIAFADIDGLYDFSGVNPDTITKYYYKNACFKVMNVKQYLKVYNKSKEDGYRQKKKNNADTKKIEFIENYLAEQKQRVSNFEFVLATKKDLKAVKKLYSDVIKSTLTTWDSNYPSAKMLKENILNKELFCLKDQNEIVGVVYITNTFESEDAGRFENCKNPYRFARICTKPELQGIGIGYKLVEKTLDYIKNQGGDAVKISVYVKNESAISTYKKFNFIQTGEDHKYGFDFYLYELLF